MIDTYHRANTPSPSESLREHPYGEFNIYTPPDDKDHLDIQKVTTRGTWFEAHRQNLTPAFTRTLVWGALGKTADETARDLALSSNTIKVHRVGLFARLGATSMAHAAGIAFDTDIFVPGPTLEISGLTKRQLTVLRLISQGSSNDEIADQLHLSSNTVKTHTSEIRRIMNVSNMAHAVTLGYLSRQLPRMSEQ